MKNTAFLPNSLDGPKLDLLVKPKKSRMEEQRDEARLWARYYRTRFFWGIMRDAVPDEEPDWLKEKS
jgi:hypothetical protein